MSRHLVQHRLRMPNTSVIMPCFNHGHFIEESAKAILGQTDGDLELIIVDDRSVDGSWAIIQTLARGDSRIRAIRHDTNRGAACSRNDGLQVADGAFIGFCDADDIWDTCKLRTQLNLFETNPGFDVIYSDSTIINARGVPVGEKFSDRFRPPQAPSGRLFNHLIARNFINMQTVLMRKACLERVRGFDESIKWVEDWWFWIRLSHHFKFLYSSQPLAKYRVHPASTNLVRKRSSSLNRIKVFRRILREFSELPPVTKSKILHNIGGELCDLGMRSSGHRFIRESMAMALTDGFAFGRLITSVGRLAKSAAGF